MNTKKTDLKLRQTVNRKKARSGGEFTFKITVRNDSPASAFNSLVCQRLPRGFRVVRAPGAKVGPGRKICWKIGQLNPGKARDFTLKIRGFSKKTKSFSSPVTLSGENVTRKSREKKLRIVVPRKPRRPRPVTG